MSNKLELIQRMLEMQKKFIEFERKQGVDAKDYFTPEASHELAGYRQEYAELANKVVNLAHEEKGSIR